VSRKDDLFVMLFFLTLLLAIAECFYWLSVALIFEYATHNQITQQRNFSLLRYDF